MRNPLPATGRPDPGTATVPLPGDGATPRARRMRLALGVLNVLGGAAVLASYADGIARVAAGEALWGGVPGSLRPVYVASMLLAAVGYFPMTGTVLFALDPARTRVADRFGYQVFLPLYALILVPSAVWMPLTVQMIAAPSPALWAAIRITLALVALGSLGVLAALALARPAPPRALRALALAGAALFFVHTALLDAVIWPALF